MINDPVLLAKVNSMTKYPSILTYHQLGERGRLDDHVQVPFDASDELIVTEKVDGTNTRFIFLPENDYLIGSREDLIHARGDRIWIPTGGIVDTIRDTSLYTAVEDTEDIIVLYGEVYGGKASSGSKNYTGKGNAGFRLFDVVRIEAGELFQEMLTWDRAKIASWREAGGQQFLKETSIVSYANRFDLDTTPRLAEIKGSELPIKHEDVLEWLKKVTPKTQCRLDDGAKAKSEGVVVRTKDRRRIAKIRYEDYERTLRPQNTHKKDGKR